MGARAAHFAEKRSEAQAGGVRGVHHVAVQVTDLRRAEDFYGGLLGLQVIRRWPAEDGFERSLWLDTGDGSFLAIERAGPGQHPRASEFRDGQPGWHLVALAIDASARDEWERKFEAAKVEVVHRSPFTLYVRDPDGNRVGLSHYPVEK